MKLLMNCTNSADDMSRYSSREDLIAFYSSFGLDGLELMQFEDYDGDSGHYLSPEMVVGQHLVCVTDWMDQGEQEQEALFLHYRRQLELAESNQAEYVVFHLTQASEEECYTLKMKHRDEEVIRAASDLINRLLDGMDYDFYFLMENLWYPGLRFTDREMTGLLLDLVHYEKKGLMLDTGHFLHLHPELNTEEAQIRVLMELLEDHKDFLPAIRGIHLHHSLSGDYIRSFLEHPPIPPEDPNERAVFFFEHIFSIDRHEPFTHSEIREVVRRIDPDYVTLEYITRSREELERYLKQGTGCFS